HVLTEARREDLRLTLIAVVGHVRRVLPVDDEVGSMRYRGPVVELVTTPHLPDRRLTAFGVHGLDEPRGDLRAHLVVLGGFDDAVSIAPLQIDIDVPPLSARMGLRARPVDARAIAPRLQPRLERLQMMVRSKVP